MKGSKRILCFLMTILTAVSLTACATSQQSSASQPPDTQSVSEEEPSLQEEPESQQDEAGEPEDTAGAVTDQAGREVAIEGPVERIVSGYYISTSACLALGLEDRLVGIEAGAGNRPIYEMAAPGLLELPNVGTAKEFNLEGCLALEPDLVILPKRLQDSADTMAELGIPVLLVSPENHEDLVGMLNLIGKAAGVEDSAQKLIQYYNDELAAISGLVVPMSQLPVVYMGGNGAYLSTAPKDMYQASLIRSAGGINAADEIEGDNWTDVSYEQLVAMNPEVIVVPAEAGYSVQDILDDTQLADVTAVQEQRVYQMPKGFEAWDSPVPSCTLGIRWMLSALHEDVYTLEELRADAAAFYKEFYGVESIDTGLIGK